MKYDIIVVGGGHAGIEAAHAGARKGLQVLLITSHLDLIGQMSCNPAIGGIAKGNIVREVDALGGLMGRLADAAGIHFRMLNRSKGMAVWGNRAQADKRHYRDLARAALEAHPGISLLQGFVTGITTDDKGATGVAVDSGERIEGRAIVVAAGTFLNGLAHVGLNSFPCGRSGEPPSLGLTASLASLGISSSRLKTGTSPRIDGRTVDFSKLECQCGDDEPWPFSYWTAVKPVNKTVCWIARTNPGIHDVIRNNLDRSPLYAGKIRSIGPRYCPSIEDKVVRFGDRDAHTLFLEPEGLDTHEMYLNGLSTSLPFDVQIEMVRRIPGFGRARVLRPGYAIEYDYFQPLQLKPTLESKLVASLYFAGQVNGTSGYEEAACQGLAAGINAAEQVLGGPGVVLPRSSSYIGVLIDDLVSKGTEEPYRMFTSRAEHRLLLRQDNADERLMPLARERGLISEEQYERRCRVWDEKRTLAAELRTTRIAPEEWNNTRLTTRLTQTHTAAELLRRPGVQIGCVIEFVKGARVCDEAMAGVEADVKYEGFVDKQRLEVERQRKFDQMHIPEIIDYDAVEGLLTDSREKLKRVRPGSLGQASRIPGVTPADISILMVYLCRGQIGRVSRETAGI